MDEYVVYVLYSPNSDRIYIGFTSALIDRFYSHNTYSKKGHTIRYRPWIVLEVEFFRTKSEAMTREKQLKSGQGRKYIREMVIPKYQKIGFISA